MTEKWAKKARVLFDPKEKEKYRYAALESILVSMESEDERKAFITDNIEYLGQLTLDTFNICVEKFDLQRDYREKFEKSMGRESFYEIFHFPKMVEWLVEFGDSKLYDLKSLENIYGCLKRLIVPGSHPLLRREGMRLVLFWMRRRVTDEIREMFSTAIDLRQFGAAGEIQPEFPACGKPLVETPLSRQAQAEMLFDDTLALLTYDPDATRPSLNLLYKEFQKAYLAILYPTVFAEYKMIRSAELGFTSGAPARLQVVLLKYLLMWLQRDPNIPHTDRIPVACFIFEEMLLGSAVDSEIVHEVIRQGLLLPWEYSAVIREVMGLLRWWVFQAAARRPVFLKEDQHGLLKDCADIEGGLMEVYTDRYIRRIMSIFDGRPSFGVEVGQFEVYRDALAFLRAIAMGHYWRPTEKIWTNLVSTCLGIVSTHFAVAPKNEIITIPEKANVIAEILAETIVGVYVRSETKEKEQWEKLSSVLASATRWRPVMTQWAKTVNSLTALLISTTVVSGSLAVATPSSFVRISSIEDLTSDLMKGPWIPDNSQDNFLVWSHSLVGPNLSFLWRNWVRALGNLSTIPVPEHHEIAVRTLAHTWDELDHARQNTNGAILDPRINEFTEALFEAAELQDARPYESSRCVAIASLARILQNTARRTLPDSFIPRFYLAVISGLADKDARLAHVTLRCSSQIFSSSLPAPAVLVPAYMKCMAGILNGSSCSPDILVAMMRLLSTISIIPDVYETMKVPRIDAPLSSMAQLPVTHAGEVSIAEVVRTQTPCLVGLIADLAKTSKDPQRTFSQLISTISILLLNELLGRTEPDNQAIDAYLGLLLKQLDFAESPSSSILSCVETLCAMTGNELITSDRLLFITQSILSAAHSSSQASNDARTVLLLRALASWLMALPLGFLTSDNQICKQLVELLLQCLNRGNEAEVAAKLLFDHLLIHLDNYPSRSSATVEWTAESIISFGKDNIFSLKQNDGSVSCSLEGPTGAYHWEFKPLISDGKAAENSVMNSLELGKVVKVDSMEPYKPRFISSSHSFPLDTPPVYDPATVSLEEEDMLKHMLSYLDEEFPESIESGFSSEHISPDRREAVEAMRIACEDLVHAEQQLSKQCRELSKTMEETSSRLSHSLCKSTKPERLPSKFDHGRLLLSQLGLMNQYNGQEARLPVSLLGQAKSLSNELGSLKSLSSCHQHKIALIYAGPGCKDEAGLFAEDLESSASYDDFTRAVGSYVSIEKLSFTGGLSPEETKNGHVLFFENSTAQIIFHEPSRINGEAPIKKRHVGNDTVHVIWNETGSLWSPMTIRSDFGNVQIVITPKPSDGLYAVNIFVDTRMSRGLVVGPLFDGALLTRSMLAPLVRATALSADRALSFNQNKSCLSKNRLVAIETVVDKHALGSWSKAQVLAQLVYPPDNKIPDDNIVCPVIIEA